MENGSEEWLVAEVYRIDAKQLIILLVDVEGIRPLTGSPHLLRCVVAVNTWCPKAGLLGSKEVEPLTGKLP